MRISQAQPPSTDKEEAGTAPSQCSIRHGPAQAEGLLGHIRQDARYYSREIQVNILLVEDMEDNRFLISVFLKALPYRLDLAEHGAAGVEKFQSGQYDLVLMDIQMPVMDGYEAVRLIRQWEETQQRGTTPIIALTGNTREEDVEKTRAAGFTAHMTKPLKKNTLLETIQRYAVNSSGQELAS